MRIQRGSIYVADLNPAHGAEPGKVRPVVVVQTDLLNPTHSSTLICPMTTHVKKSSRYLRVHLNALETGLDKDSDIMVDQLRAIDNRRLTKQAGHVPSVQMRELARNLQILLDLDQF